ncbi:BON domain-containing protein [Pannonibacter sp. Q-1]
MADRRYEERYYDERNDQSRGRPRYGREGRSMEDERSLYWPTREYDRPQARDDDDDRYGSSYRRDQDPYENGSMYGRMYGREPGRAPGRLPQSYGRQDYGRPDYGVQDDGNAFGFARHDQRHDEQRRGWDDERRWGRNSESGMYGGPGYENGPGFPPRVYDPGMLSALQGQGRRETGARGFRGHGPKDYKRSDDRIREDVCDRLVDADTVDASGITVEVSNGEVTLNGHVSSRQAKRAAEDCIEDCSGVQHVQNNLRVQEASGDSDESSGTGTAGTRTAARTRPKES